MDRLTYVDLADLGASSGRVVHGLGGVCNFIE
jgi:hypothetical protein